MTVAKFNEIIDRYQHARENTRWVMKNLDAPGINTAELAKAAYTSAMDQETAGLRELVEAARVLKVVKV